MKHSFGTSVQYSPKIAFIIKKTRINSYFCASNKLYEYLNLGVKVLTNNTAGVARVVKHGENGFCCDCITVDEVRKGLITLLNMKNFVPTDYYWSNQEEHFLSIYK